MPKGTGYGAMSDKDKAFLRKATPKKSMTKSELNKTISAIRKLSGNTPMSRRVKGALSDMDIKALKAIEGKIKVAKAAKPRVKAARKPGLGKPKK